MMKTKIKKETEKTLRMVCCKEMEGAKDTIVINGLLQYPNKKLGNIRIDLYFGDETLEIRLILDAHQYPINISRDYYGKMGINQDVIDNYIIFSVGAIKYDDLKAGDVFAKMDRMYRLVMHALCIDIYDGHNDMQTVFG